MKTVLFTLGVFSFFLLTACSGLTITPGDNGGNSNTLDDLLGMETLVIPYFDVDGNTVRTTVGEGEQQTTYIKASEMQAMITAVDILMGAGATISDFDGSFELSKLVTSSGHTAVLNSAIFHATLSRELIRLAEEHDVVIPYKDENGVDIRVTQGENTQLTNYVTKSELQALVNALYHLLGDNSLLSDFTAEFQVDKLVEASGINIVFESSILQATISKRLFDLEIDDTIVIPYYDVFDEGIRITVGTDITETTYITKIELQAIVNALDIILGDNAQIEDFTGNIVISDFAGEVPHTSILNSAIIHATISREILNLSSDDYIIPYVDENGIEIRVIKGIGAEETTYITKTEIQALIDAVYVLIGEAANFDEFNGTFTMGVIFDPIASVDERDTILASAIIHATISKILFDLDETDDFIVVPTESADGLTEVRITHVSGLDESKYVFSDEVKMLIEVFVVMGYSDLDLLVNINSEKFFEERETILYSHIMHATISYQMLNETGGNLIVPNFEADDITEIRLMTLGSIEYITRAEILAILEALEAFGLLDFANISMKPSDLFYDGDLNPIDYEFHINASRSIQSTISKFILELAEDESIYGSPLINATLVVPTTLREDIEVGEEVDPGDNVFEQIEKEELLYILDAIKELNLADYNSTFDDEIITNMDDVTLLYILRSGSIHVTIDVMLKDNDNLDIPDQATGTLYGLVEEIVVKTEIVKLMLAVQISAQTSFTTATFTDLGYLATLNELDRAIIFDSLIVQKTLTPTVDAAILFHQTFVDPLYVVPDSYYHDDDPATFFTGTGIENVLVDLGLV